MAGIGFEISKILRQGTYTSLLRAYGFTTLMGSGPGLFVIIGLGIVFVFAMYISPIKSTAYQFLTIVVYLFSASMIVSSLLQYTFIRFIADKIFLKEFNKIASNLNGVILLQLFISVCFALPIIYFFFYNYSILFNILLFSTFIVLCLIWILTVLLTGVKNYRRILIAFALAYSIFVSLYLITNNNSIEFFLFDFLLAQVILLLTLLYAIMDYYPTSHLIQFDYLKKNNFYFGLVFANFFYNLGIWIDKHLFWFNSDTSYVIFPPLRFSPIYDLPMFIAYLCIVPTTATFLLQIESKFALVYPKYMQTIFKRKTLAEIDAVRNNLILTGRDAVYSLFKTQSVVIIILLLSMTYLFTILSIHFIYLNILSIILIAGGLNVILWGLLNILYYMTRYTQALCVTLIFLVSNFIFTLITLKAGPLYFGYGFSFSLLLSIACAMIFLNENFKNLEYSTFMMTD